MCGRTTQKYCCEYFPGFNAIFGMTPEFVQKISQKGGTYGLGAANSMKGCHEVRNPLGECKKQGNTGYIEGNWEKHWWCVLPVSQN